TCYLNRRSSEVAAAQGQTRPCNKLLLVSLDLAQTGVEELLEGGARDWVLGRESDGSLRQVEPCELVARRFHRLWAERKHTEVVLACPDAEQRAPLVLERRQPVARRLLGVRHFAPNYLANPFELRPLRLGNSCKVFVERRHRLPPAHGGAGRGRGG